MILVRSYTYGMAKCPHSQGSCFLSAGVLSAALGGLGLNIGDRALVGLLAVRIVH